MNSLLAQTSAGDSATIGLWSLFAQSFDLFTIVLLLGSLVAVGLIVRAALEIRAAAVAPEDLETEARKHAAAGNAPALAALCEDDTSFIGPILLAAARSEGDKDAAKEAAELAAGEQIALWFRKVELLSLIGNVAPLVGLAGTVWGMILAFTTLGDAGGQAGPAALSLGISKALFHTLLGLCLAIPCLVVYGIYRSILDRLCTRAMATASDILALLEKNTDRGA